MHLLRFLPWRWGLWKSRRCSTDTSFKDAYNLPDFVINRLAKQRITHANDLQRKCLGPLLAGDHSAAVINAETGSGKTYCFLLPVVKLFADLWEGHGRISSPSAIVLVPTPHLGYQIENVYQSLALSEWGSYVAHKSTRLLLKPSTSLVIATPSTLMQYDLNRILRHVQLLCVDEADVLLTGSEREPTWRILDTMKQLSTKDKMTQIKSSTPSHLSDSVLRNGFEGVLNLKRQLIFTAATLPSGGRQTVQSRLKKWLPKNTLYVSTDNTHQLLPTALMRFIDVGITQPTSPNLDTPANFSRITKKLTEIKRQQLIRDLHLMRTEINSQPKIIIFCNSVASAHSVFSYLTGPRINNTTFDPATPGEQIKSKQYPTKATESVSSSELCTLNLSDPPVYPPWWTGKVGKLYRHDDTSVEELEHTLQQFRTGETCVLVASDLGCRGLDMQDVTAVVQFDFPGNVADFLHRAGRTARAGKSGIVISYVDPSSRDVADEIKAVIADESKTFERLFSRNKMLRRKIKRRQQNKMS